jgi:beta-N-acetylhexosaminidase
MSDADLSSVGDHFMIGLRPGTTLDDRDRALLGDLRPGGVILFKSNFVHGAPYDQWLEVHAKFIDSIRRAAGRDRLFIAIDHEGGRVCRTPPPITRYASAAWWGETAREVGEGMGRELASLGLNLNFAPVLDINSNPANPVIGERAFGRTPEEVISAALPFIAGMETHGVMACGKHFPGHGDTKADSHYELPFLDLSPEELEARELKPFVAAIRAGIEMIMTSHIVFTTIDKESPATLSRKLTHDLLRSKCGFNGVIVSDDVGMHAMDGLLGAPDSALRFLAAGNDVLMITSHWTDTERTRVFARSLLTGRQSGLIDEAALDESRDRVRSMLSRTPQNAVQALTDDDFEKHRHAGPLFSGATVNVV